MKFVQNADRPFSRRVNSSFVETPRFSDSFHQRVHHYFNNERTQEELSGLFFTEDNTKRVLLKKLPRSDLERLLSAKELLSVLL